jgi:hypothetical protein
MAGGGPENHTGQDCIAFHEQRLAHIRFVLRLQIERRTSHFPLRHEMDRLEVRQAAAIEGNDVTIVDGDGTGMA